MEIFFSFKVFRNLQPYRRRRLSGKFDVIISVALKGVNTSSRAQLSFYETITIAYTLVLVQIQLNQGTGCQTMHLNWHLP